MNEPTETDREWNEGISPECKVFDEVMAVERNDAEQAMFDELAAYARKHGGGDVSIAWGRLRARNALRDGRSPSYAYDVGRQAIDDVLGSVGRMGEAEAALRRFGQIASGAKTIDHHPYTESWVENYQPITTAYNAAKAMGVLDLCTTATGVAGHYQHEGRWFRVTLDAVGSEPQMRLGE